MDLKVLGIGRIADNEKAVLISFNRCLSDDELRNIHCFLRTNIADDMPVSKAFIKRLMAGKRIPPTRGC